MKYIVAIDSFKGCITSTEANQAATEGILSMVPDALIAGRISDRQQLLDAGFAHVECINPPTLPIEEALKPETAKRNIAQTTMRLAPIVFII